MKLDSMFMLCMRLESLVSPCYIALRAKPFRGVSESCSHHRYHHVLRCVSEGEEICCQLCFLRDEMYMSKEPVANPASNFINVRQSVCITSNNLYVKRLLVVLAICRFYSGAQLVLTWRAGLV